jgi:ABC-type phosphate/phosphonate transport system ATPase subunit
MAKRELSNPTREKNPAAVALSKLGAAKGGVARAKKLSPARRSRIARLGAKARWAAKG